jgi:hypothetical protein
MVEPKTFLILFFNFFEDVSKPLTFYIDTLVYNLIPNS